MRIMNAMLGLRIVIAAGSGAYKFSAFTQTFGAHLHYIDNNPVNVRTQVWHLDSRIFKI